MLDQARINALRGKAIPAQRLFIGGQWQNAQSRQTLDVISPINGKVISTLADANEADVDTAVQTARAAFKLGNWSQAAPSERKKVMQRIAELLQQHALELAVLGVRDNGTEISMAFNAEPNSASNTFRYYAESIDKVYG
ncbi:MAG TPA: aldehyde dehydrogenase family protein, partial [Thiolinea sp.]|nr:aldehyde dehydrogenase family protein [Thiolinea sp.]